MIYPSRRLILAAAAVAPAALLVGVYSPPWWTAGLGLLVVLFLLALLDAVLGPAVRQAELGCGTPYAVSVGETFPVALWVKFTHAAPRRAWFAIDTEGPVAAAEGLRSTGTMGRNAGTGTIELTAERRGTARVARVWLRWRGPLGLVWKQRAHLVGQQVLVVPDIRPVRDKGIQMANREALYGQKAQLQVGEGAEFEALAAYRQGMDRRAIDWKQSARHASLIAKEYRTERNNNIVMALDAGRVMSEPFAGQPRIDRAVSAALLASYVALKDGDRVGFFAFDSRPRASSKPIGGSQAFSTLQRVAAGIDYSASETNYTLGISTLAAGLNRRSLIIVFTEFADTTSAELMLAAIGTLLERHLVLFVVLRDEELEAYTAAEPQAPEDVSRAVTAAGLLQERQLVLTRLRHLGVHVLEASAAEAGPALVSAYLGFKRRGML